MGLHAQIYQSQIHFNPYVAHASRKMPDKTTNGAGAPPQERAAAGLMVGESNATTVGKDIYIYK